MERQTARDQSLDEQARLAAIVESSEDAIIGLTLDGTVVDWNPGAERLFGYTAAEMKGNSVCLILPQDLPREWPAILAKIRRGEGVKHHETVRRHKDGKMVDVSLTVSPIKDRAGRVIGVSWVSRDIGDHKRMERELARAHEDLEQRIAERTADLGRANLEHDALLEQLRRANDELAHATMEAQEQAEMAQRRARELEAVVASIADAVLVCDKEGHIVDLNAAALRLFDTPGKDHMYGPTTEYLQMLDVRHVDGRPIAPENLVISRALRGEVVQAYEEIARDLRSGGDISLLVSGAPIRDRKGNLVGAVEVLSDITRLRELDRLKDQFIAVAAHELKTPVAIMKGYAQALMRPSEEVPPRQRRMLDAIDRGADRIDRIVKDLLDISRLYAGGLELTIERIDLPELVTEVVDRMALSAPKHSLRIVRADPVVVQGDRYRLDQVLVNLLDNAIKYAPRGGRVEVAVKMQDNREAIVSVSDRGVGIPKDKQHAIFQRFYSAHTGTPYDYGGMGVGLYIAKEIISRHGGRIWFESEEAKGSSFHFSLPLTHGD